MNDKKTNENPNQTISIERLSSLAKLSLSETEAEDARGELKKMADYTYLHLNLESDALPFSYPSCESGLREDTPYEYGFTEKILACAPATKDRYIVVPQVIEKEDG